MSFFWGKVAVVFAKYCLPNPPSKNVGLGIDATRKIKVQAMDGINEILLCTMKSSQNSDEIFSIRLR